MGSENCLFANVDTPRDRAGKLPVMVFLHGGGFTSGQGATYQPTRITQKGVVVVTLNYRLGALGYLAHPGMREEFAGNFGLADQQAALRWVRSNIAAFGGDPSNVTLWGQSAGAFSVCAQLSAPGARGLFHKAIIQSGPCGNSLVTRSVANNRGTTTATSLGCSNPHTAMECLRRKPLNTLVGLHEDQVSAVRRHIAGMPWQPVVGTAAVPVQPLTAIRLGHARMPMIHGSTTDELRPFVANAHDGTGKPLTTGAYPGAVRDVFGHRETPAILAKYPANKYPSPGIALATMLTDYGRTLGACSSPPALAAASRWAPAYGYEFAEPSTESIGTFPLGSYHGYDVRQMFDSRFPSEATRSTTAGPVADRVITYWTQFARTGDPGREWPTFHRDTVLSLTSEQVTPINLSRAHNCDFWRSR